MLVTQQAVDWNDKQVAFIGLGQTCDFDWQIPTPVPHSKATGPPYIVRSFPGHTGQRHEHDSSVTNNLALSGTPYIIWKHKSPDGHLV